LRTNAIKKISTSLPATYDYISASVVCGSTYFAVATNAPVAEGLLVVDMQTGSATLQQTEGNLAHALACSPTAGKLVMVVSAFTTPRTTFSLREYDVASQTTRVLYTFPRTTLWGGWDSTFSLAKTGELWATFPLGNDIMKYRRGELYIVDTVSGALKEHKTVAKLAVPGEPYLVVPGKGDTFSWLLAKDGEGSAAEKLQLCTADKSGKEIRVSDCKKASELWAAGSTAAICNGTTYIAAGGPFAHPTMIYALSASGNYEVRTTIDLHSADHAFGSLTCGSK